MPRLPVRTSFGKTPEVTCARARLICQRLSLRIQSSQMDLVPFHRRPVVRTVAGALLWLVVYLVVLRLAGPSSRSLAILFDLGLFVSAFVVIVALASQFVLPVQTWSDRSAALQRLLDYALGSRGPVLFLRNGQTIESKGERSRRGPGVLLADTTSAGVLRTETRFTRAVGPGVTFTAPGERLADSLDLRPQVRLLEGRRSTGDTTPDSQPDPTALTEDGIQVSADLRATFMLDPGHVSAPRRGQFPHLPPYEFNPRAAERAVYGHAYRGGEQTHWSDLPLLLAVDVWREQVKRWRLEDLLTGGGDGPSPLAQIEAALEARLVISTEHTEGGQATPTREMDVLRRRGIRVLRIEVAGLHVPAEVREEHLRRWREEWGSAVEEGVLEARGRGQEARWQGELEGQRALLREVTHSLRAELSHGGRPGRRDTLTFLLEDGKRLLAEPGLLADTGALSDHLRQLADEVRRLGPDGRGGES